MALRPVLGGFHLTVAVGGSHVPPDEPPQRSLVVVGEATVRVEADALVVTCGVQTSGGHPSQCLRDNTAITLRVVQSLLALGIAQADIRSSGFGVYGLGAPVTPAGDRTQDLASGVVSLLTVHLADASRLADVLEAATRGGANVGIGVNAAVRDSSAARRAALLSAAQDARSKAEALAAALGKQLGEPIATVEEASASAWPTAPLLSGGVVAPAVGATTNPAGAGLVSAMATEFQHAARVRVTYALV